MAPQWMPQNVQKRLLRYVLQQLSVFSEIDLPNLDVSLGTNSKVNLREVQLDPEKISLPGVFLRDGKVNNLELLLTVGGGVNIEAKGIEMILAPSSNASNNKKGKFSLAQSTAELANSIMLDRYDDDVVDDDLESSSEFSSSNGDDGEKNGGNGGELENNSRLNAVMIRAAELALSRLRLELYDINITVIADTVTVKIHISHVSFNSADGIRSIKFEGVDFILINPKASPGETMGDFNLESEEELENDKEDENDDDYEHDDEEEDMMSSSILGKKESLMDSMVFSHEEASSLYMSATSHFSKKSTIKSKKSDIPTRLMYINKGEVSFQGFQEIEDSNITIDQINVSLTPWPEALTGVIQTITRILKLNNLQKKQSSSSSSSSRDKTVLNNRIVRGVPIRIDLESSISDDTIDDDDDDDAALLFEDISINNITFDLNSALLDDGLFAKDDTLKISLQTIKVAQDNIDQFKGFVNTVKILKGNDDKVIAEYDQSLEIDEADITFKFEKLKNGHKDTNVVISKPAKLDFDLYSVADFLKFWKFLTPLLEFLENSSSSSSSSSTNLPHTTSILRSQLDSRRYNNLVPKPKKHSEPVSKFSLQTESISLNLKLSHDISIDAIIFPISFNNLQNTLVIEQILFNMKIGPHYLKQIASLQKIEYQKFNKDEIVRTFGITSNNQFDVSNILMSSKLSVDSIGIIIEFCDLQKLVEEFKNFNTLLSELSDLNSQSSIEKPKKRVRLNNTTFFQKSLSMFIQLEKLDVKVFNVNTKFGGISLSFQNITSNIFKDTSLRQLFIMNGSINRVLDGELKEPCFGIASADDNKSPIFGAKLRDKTILNFYLRNVSIDYYTRWLSLFDTPSSKAEPNKLPVNETTTTTNKQSRLEIRSVLSDCIIGLNPGRLAAKALVVIKKGNADVEFGKELSVKSSLKTLSILLIDDVANILSDSETKHLRQWNSLRANTFNAPSWSQVSTFILKGYVSVANINALHSTIIFNNQLTLRDYKGHSTKSLIDMKINSDDWNVELCADSAQCLTQLLNDLKQPVNVTFEEKYKPASDGVVNIFDNIEEFAFQNSSNKLDQSTSKDLDSNSVSNSLKSNPSLVDSYYASLKSSGDMAFKTDSLEHEPSDDDLINSNDLHNTIYFNDGHFDNRSIETLSPKINLDDDDEDFSPLSIYFGASKITLNLFDGYDWKETRDTISGVVKRVLEKAVKVAKDLKDNDSRLNSDPPSRGSTRRDSFGEMGFLPDFSGGVGNGRMVGETLYDSIILSLPVGSDIASMTDNINRDMGVNDDDDDESISMMDSTSENGFMDNANVDPTINLGKHTGKKLRLRRSKYQKVSIELYDVDFEMIVLTNYDPTRDPPRSKNHSNEDGSSSSETINTMEIKVRDLFIVDNVPTSTWNRFATYMTDAGIKEIGVSMFQMKIETVRPVSNLAATELILDVNVLPLSLHVDQDTLDFLARFGEFKDNRFLLIDPYEDVIYIQKFSVNAVKIKLDYKPKKIDYNGIRSGHTSEFMNLFILDEAEMILKKVSLYGISGFPRLNKMLNDCWMPDIKSTQLSGVLAGLAPVRSVVKIGSGFKYLVAVPAKEYKKDGRVVRSLQQGAVVFAKTTSNELLKFGVKLAAGTQTALENAEGALGGEGSSGRLSSFRREQAAANMEEEEHLFAITNVKSPSRKNNIEASLIGRSAYTDSIEPAMRGGGFQSRLDSFEDVDNSGDDELPSAVTNLRTSSGKPFVIGEVDDDEEEVISFNDQVDDDDDDDERQRFVSLYADQPHDMREGLQAAYSSLGRNFSTARDALREAGTSISASDNAKSALMAIAKATPVAVMRPIIGTTEAISKALLGGMNQLDPSQRLKSEEKYKSTR